MTNKNDSSTNHTDEVAGETARPREHSAQYIEALTGSKDTPVTFQTFPEGGTSDIVGLQKVGTPAA